MALPPIYVFSIAVMEKKKTKVAIDIIIHEGISESESEMKTVTFGS